LLLLRLLLRILLAVEVVVVVLLEKVDCYGKIVALWVSFWCWETG